MAKTYSKIQRNFWETETRADKRPMLSDLRESAGIVGLSINEAKEISEGEE